MERRKALSLAAATALTVGAGGMAMAANFGLLSHADDSTVGHLNATNVSQLVDQPVAKKRVEVIIEDPNTSPTVGPASGTGSSAAPTVAATDPAGPAALPAAEPVREIAPAVEPTMADTPASQPAAAPAPHQAAPAPVAVAEPDPAPAPTTTVRHTEPRDDHESAKTEPTEPREVEHDD